MASSDEMVNVLEECRVSPPPNAVGEKSLPLTFFDLLWLHFHLVQRNLLFPPNLREPEIHYVDGDSVSMTFAEFNRDFAYLIKNHQRKVAHFYPLLPQLPPVTLFPNSGISFGFTFDHVVVDGNAFIRFIRLWATIHKLQREPLMLEGAILPFYDRTMVKDPNKLGSIFWQHHQKIKFEGYRPLLPTSNILAAILLSQVDLQRLKKGYGSMPNVVTCLKFYTRVWSGEEVSENELEHFGFVADCRACLDPPLPENYFANLIGEAIQEKLGSNKGVLEGLDKWVVNFSSINIERAVGVAGSARFAVYGIDFGLGQLQKRESISIDETRCISLHEGKDNKGDIQVGLSFPKIKMDAFASIFTNGLSVYD
ncbi:hypothetical protein AAG906_040121 [Vitis piasezkii]